MNSNPRSEWLLKPDGLAVRLRARRMQAYAKAADFAAAVGFTRSKVSRIENGLIFPSPDDIRRWVTVTGGTSEEADHLVELAAEGETLWADHKRILRAGLEEAQADVDQLIADNDRIAYCETMIMPGPLQTAGYAEALLPMLAPGIAADDLAAAVVRRVRRWEAIYDPSKQWELLMVESVLRLWPGPEGASVMSAQLGHIQSVLSLENVRLGVIPMDRELMVWPSTPFAVYGDDQVMVELFGGAQTIQGEKAKQYREFLVRLWSQAVEDPNEVVVMIDRARAATSP